MSDDPETWQTDSSRPTAMPVYLDNHATTRVDPRVVTAMLPYFDELFGNAASINHSYGTEAAGAVAEARRQIAGLLNAPPETIVFTSGGTESNNLALKGVLAGARPGSHLIVCAAEHRSVLDPARRLARRGCELTIVPVDRYGQVDPQSVADAIRPGTALVSAMLANNEVGTINPVAEIAAVCRAHNVPVHCDAVQAIGKISVDVVALGADLISLSAHKLYGPKGTGALYVRDGDPPIRIEPLLDGGGHERRLRSGTLAVPLIVGFGEACRLAREVLSQEAAEIGTLRDRLWDGFCERLSGIALNGHPTDRLPGNLNVSFAGVDGEQLMNGLSQIAVSSGSACTSADPEPSHVLRAMGVPESLSKASLRFGLGRFNTAADVDLAIEHVAEVVERLRQHSSTH
ncbi:MAG: cysteine desulfurase [Planctomycetia bacterium]|nr:cysteine desulfurase [Planctomycetia bacterium]